MGNCLLKKCPFYGKAIKDDAKYEFDPEKDIKIEPREEPKEMVEINNDVESEIELGQRHCFF